MTTRAPKKQYGPYSAVSILAGVASLFFGSIYASLLGMAAALLGLMGVRKRQKLCMIAMYLGCLATLFATLQNLGIIRPPSDRVSDKSHLINSIKASIRVHEILKEQSPLSDRNKRRVIEHLRHGLEEAEKVNLADVDDQVPGFAAHYQDEFIEGVRLMIGGFERSHTGQSLKGAVLLEKWALWNRENRKELGKIKEPVPSIVSILYCWIAG
jgi:hypothetical protein